MNIRNPNNTNTRERSIAYEWEIGPTGKTSYRDDPEIEWVELSVSYNKDRKIYRVSLGSFTKMGNMTGFTVGGGIYLNSTLAKRFSAKVLHDTMAESLRYLPQMIESLDDERRERASLLLSKICNNVTESETT